MRSLEKEAMDALGNEKMTLIKNKEIEEAYELGLLRQMEELANE